MAKNDLRRAVLQPNNGSIVIYYSKNGIMRFPTGITISKEKTREGKYKEWDYKAAFIKTTVADYNLRKKTLEVCLNRANDILSKKFEEGFVLSASELENHLASDEKTDKIAVSAELMEMYERFWTRKKDYFLSRNKPASLKDFTSLKHLLQGFEIVKGTKFFIRDVDKFFLEDLLNWMRQSHPEQLGSYLFKTKGNLNAKTCKKRFDVLLQFFRFLKDLKIVYNDRVDIIRKFMAKELRVVKTNKVSLTIYEVHKLYRYNFGSSRLNKIRDLFVFACFTGMRWGDIRNFDSRFITTSADGIGKVYKRKAVKTKDSSGVSYEIPLCSIVLEILDRYQDSLNPLLISNVKANEYIKEALKITGYFNDVSEVIHKHTGEYKKRYEAITMHKGRDTFISNLVQTTPLNELMKYTGHTKLSTLQEYIDKTRGVSMSYIRVFDLQPED